ncbi:MAG: hypothetical protein ABF289_02375, partial [Clostridiales bacterium]
YSKPHFERYSTGPESVFSEEEEFYRNKNLKYEKNIFKINFMDLDIDLRNSVSVIGDINIKLLKNTNNITFTLYRKLKVKEIILNNKKIKFNQNDDNFKIYFPEKYYKNKTLTIKINYEGLTSQKYFSGDKASYLTSKYAWLPYPGNTNVFYTENTNINTTPLENNNIVKYTINVKHNYDKLVTNLNKHGNKLFGKSNGVSLIGGNLNYFSLNNKQYYYNSTFVDFNFENADYERFLNKYTNVNNQIRSVLNLEEKEFDKIIMLPYSNFETRSIYQLLSTESGNLLLWSDLLEFKENYILDTAISSTINSNIEYACQDALIKRFFYESLQNYLYKKNNYKFVEQFDEKNLLKLENELFLDIIDYLSSKNDFEVKIFFQNWYKKMCSNDKVTLEDIRELFLYIP